MKKEKLKPIKFNEKEIEILNKFEKILKEEGRTFSGYIKRFIKKEVEKYEETQKDKNKNK